MEQGMDNTSNNGPMGTAQAPEQMVAEQVTVAEMGPAPAMPEAPKKKSNGMLIGLILCIVLAIGGIGFGVWMMMDSNAQKDSLNKQISDLRKQNNDLLEQVGDNNTTINIDTDDGDVDTADYIYVGEWGYKIKIPENLDMVSYSLEQRNDGYAGLDNYTSLIISGVEGYDGRLPEFADLNKNTGGMTVVVRYPIGTEIPLASPPSLIFSDDEYSYYYYHPQAVYSVGDEEVGLEVESVGLIQDMVNNTNNWSEI